MNKNFFFSRLFAITCLCFVLMAGLTLSTAFAADANVDKTKAAKSDTAKKTSDKPAKKSSGKKVSSKKGKEEAAPKGASAATGDAVLDKLNNFAHSTFASMNRTFLASKNNKQVKQNADGSFTAHYSEIDGSNLKTSYKKPESTSSGVTYVGYMTYDEVEYASTGKTRNEAMNGSFNVARRENMTELVKYINGKWTH